jgi:hypothetical protein
MNKLDKIKNSILPLNKIHNKINYGGCGTFSYYLSSKLEELHIEHKIVYLKEKETPPNSFRCDIKFTHILIKIDDYIIDNNNYYYCNNYELYELEKTKLYNMLKEPRLWNNLFDEEKREKLKNDLLSLKILF